MEMTTRDTLLVERWHAREEFTCDLLHLPPITTSPAQYTTCVTAPVGDYYQPRSPRATLIPRLYSGPGFSFSLSSPVFNPLLRGSVLRSGGPTGAQFRYGLSERGSFRLRQGCFSGRFV